MPNTIFDQFFVVDPFNPPPVGTSLVAQIFSLTDQNDDGDIDRFNEDSIDGVDIFRSYPGDTLTIDLPGGGQVTYTGVTFYLDDGREVFTPTDGQVLQDGTYASASAVTGQGSVSTTGPGTGNGEFGPPCLTPGVLVDTARGRIPVEDLREGDEVLTLDHGYQPVLWLGRTILRADARHAPVRFAKGALGNTEAFEVSPQHRMHIAGWQAELHFGLPEVFVSAVHLTGLSGVTCVVPGRVTYLHVLLPRHEIIRTAGTWSESYFPGACLDRHADEIRRALPDRFAAMEEGLRGAQLARPHVTGREARTLAA